MAEIHVSGGEKINTYQQLMRKGAGALRQLSELTGLEQKVLRARVFKSKQTVFCPTDWPELTPEQAAVFIQSFPAINELRKAEWQIVCAFSRLAKKLAAKWVKRATGVTIAEEDFEQEALMALLDAIYSYTKEDVTFITYAWWCISHRLGTVANHSNPLGALTNEALRLLRRFEETKRQANCHITDAEAYALCGFSPEEIAVVEEARVKVHSADTTAGTNEDVDCNDYTGHRRGIDNEKDTVPVNCEIRDAIQRAKLSDLERKIIETYLRPHYGWQTEIANETINPGTGKAYTKARIQQILQIALKKIRSAYLKRWVA